jgi:hypothetical protein
LSDTCEECVLTELQCDTLQVTLRGCSLNLLARGNATRKADLANAHMFGEKLASLSRSGDNLDNAFGNSRLLDQGREGKRGQRSFL